MFIYKFAVGHDIALVNLVAFSPQPRNGVVRCHRVYGDEGKKDKEKYCIFRWNVLPGSSIYKPLIENLGLYDSEESDITILTLDENLESARYNAKAIQPEFGDDVDQNNFFLKDISLYCHSLERLG